MSKKLRELRSKILTAELLGENSNLLKAKFIQEASGVPLTATASNVAKTLAKLGFPHVFYGGYAVQALGYPRGTQDVDVVVSDPENLAKKLVKTGKFRYFNKDKNSGRLNAYAAENIYDAVTGVRVDLLPANTTIEGSLTPLNFEDAKVSSTPVMASVANLISSKLGAYYGSGKKRSQDLADVEELINSNQTPRNLPVSREVSKYYKALWDSKDTKRYSS